jgi:hypothetical protein
MAPHRSQCVKKVGASDMPPILLIPGDTGAAVVRQRADPVLSVLRQVSPPKQVARKPNRDWRAVSFVHDASTRNFGGMILWRGLAPPIAGCLPDIQWKFDCIHVLRIWEKSERGGRPFVFIDESAPSERRAPFRPGHRRCKLPWCSTAWIKISSRSLPALTFSHF